MLLLLYVSAKNRIDKWCGRFLQSGNREATKTNENSEMFFPTLKHVFDLLNNVADLSIELNIFVIYNLVYDMFDY